METECTVTHDGDDRSLGLGEARRKRKGQRRPNRARRTVDDAVRGAKARLRPLTEFPAVRDEYRIRMPVEQGLQRPQRLYGMKAIGLARSCRIPCGRPIRDRGFC